MEYIEETETENQNLANGIRDALRICLNEMLDYIGDVPEDSEDEDEDEYTDYDRETANIVVIIKETLESLEK